MYIYIILIEGHDNHGQGRHQWGRKREEKRGTAELASLDYCSGLHLIGYSGHPWFFRGPDTTWLSNPKFRADLRDPTPRVWPNGVTFKAVSKTIDRSRNSLGAADWLLSSYALRMKPDILGAQYTSATDAGEQRVVYFVHRPWLFWNKDITNSRRRITKDQSTRWKEPSLCLRPRTSMGTPSLLRRTFPAETVWDARSIGRILGVFQAE